MTIDVPALAAACGKPVAYVQAAIDIFGVKELPKFRTPYDGLSDFFSALTAVFFDPDAEDGVDSKGKPFFPARSMTKQEFTHELDLNVIMARFIVSDFDPSTLPISARKALQGDFTGAPESYHEALNLVVNAKQSFMTLDADLRARFDNDPQKFLDFVSDPENRDELIELGLAVTPTEDLSTTISRSFKELGEMVVGKSGEAAVASPDPVSEPVKVPKTKKHN